MGTKRPSCTLVDTLSNINMSDRKLQPGGKISRDPSPRPSMTGKSERDRDNYREEDRRREMDQGRYRDTDPRERVPAPRMREGDRDRRERERRQEDDRSRNGRPVSNVDRGEEREVEMGRKKGDTFPRVAKSGDRDIRMMSSNEIHEEKGERRQRDRPRQMEMDDRYREREKTWQRERYEDRNAVTSTAQGRGKRNKGRATEDEKLMKRETYMETDDGFQDRRRDGGSSWDRRERERDTARQSERPRSNTGEWDARMSSPRRRGDREAYSTREEPPRREGKRDARSEGDSDERETRRERKREREREELTYEHSRSEGDMNEKRASVPNRQGYRDEDRQRYRDKDRDVDRWKRRDEDREEERRRGRDDRGWTTERREDDRYREYEQRRDKDRRKREASPRREHPVGRSSRSPNRVPPKVPPRSQSSGEWSSDMDSETRYRRGKDSRERTTESKTEAEESRVDPERAAEMRQREQKRQERDRGQMTGSVPEQRRMWLEPQRGKNSEEEFEDRERQTRRKEREREEEGSVVTQAGWGREVQPVKEEADERFADQRHAERNEYRREAEGVRVDGEEFWREEDKRYEQYLSDSSGGVERGWRGEREGENTTEESDKEEEDRVGHLARSMTGRGSESRWKQERDSMMSVEDGFVTVSSGEGEEGDDREEDEDEDFEDCQEFVEHHNKGRAGDGAGLEGTVSVEEEDKSKERPPQYVFCVIGQTLPRSESGNKSWSQGDEAVGVERDDDKRPVPRRDDEYVTNNQDTECRGQHDMSRKEEVTMGKTAGVEIRYRSSPELRAGEETRKKVENPYEEIGQYQRDSQTEKLLMEWREQNKHLVQGEVDPQNPYADTSSQASLEQIQPILDRLNTGTMSAEEVEATRIRMSGAWTISDGNKRYSQPPHLKWAKNVVSEILGQSEDQALEEEEPTDQGDKTDTTHDRQQEEASQGAGDNPVVRRSTNEPDFEPEMEEEDPLELEGLRGMGQSQADMHAEVRAMHDDTTTHTHADALLGSEGQEEDHSVDKEAEACGHIRLDQAEVQMNVTQDGGGELNLPELEKEKRRENEDKMFLSVSYTLYKPNSCPILNFESDSDPLTPSGEGESQKEDDEREGESEESEESDTVEEVGRTVGGEGMEVDSVAREVVTEKKAATVKSTCSFRDLGSSARIRRRGIRKTTEKRHAKLIEEKEEEGGVGRDRRTRIFSITDDEDNGSKSWGEVELRNVLDTIDRRKRNSRFFNAAQLYQQYSEAAQNFEILRQARSDFLPVGDDNAPSPAPSPPPARRPLPPLPPVPHPHSLSHSGSITSVQSLPLPEPPRGERRSSSPRLSISLTQTATLWRDLPGVRSSGQLEELSEDQRRLQEVRFEVVTSEASYCRSLDIVVEHFVKSKQLGALLTTQDRNWLFSRLADVRAISHSFLSKLEERMETNIVHFTVCDIIARQCQRFKMVYVPYLTNQSYQDATYQRLMNENQGFKRIVEKLERSPVCQRLPLRSFLVLPFQRITRIKLLVQNIVKRTTPGTAEATQAIKSMKLLEKLIQESNDSITQMKSIESLVSLSAKVDFECRTLPLISQSRRLVREGPVLELMDFSLKDTERSVYMHLFNDYLLLSAQKEGGRFTVLDHAPVDDLRVENCRVKLHSLQKNLFRLRMSGKSLLLRTDTQSDKLRWISALSRPHPEIDFSAAQDFTQMQCIRAFVGQQPDELSLEKADIILVHQQSSDHWVEGTRLSDRHRGWLPESHLEVITNPRVRQRNLSDALKLTTATAAV